VRPEAERISRVWLFVLAITLHNLPEGMAIGVSFANGDMNIGLPLTSAIAIQDIPEGWPWPWPCAPRGCRT
jgi:ZIP family zinc transporter